MQNFCCSIVLLYVISYFFFLRYQFSKKQAVSAAEAEKFGIKMKKPGEVTLETEFEKIKKVNHTNVMVLGNLVKLVPVANLHKS
jgi:hypothetical protein